MIYYSVFEKTVEKLKLNKLTHQQLEKFIELYN
jgi:hypothetical protein